MMWLPFLPEFDSVYLFCCWSSWLYATWSGGMRILRRPQYLFIMHMNSIFLSGDSSMIGLTFTLTPSFHGFGRGRSVRFLSISGGYFLQMISGRSPLSFRELSQRDFIHYKTLRNFPCWYGTACWVFILFL